MPNSVSAYGFVKKTGDTMSGALTLNGIPLIFQVAGVDYARILAPGLDKIRIYNRNGMDNGDLQMNDLDVRGDVLMQATKTVDGVDVSTLVGRAILKTGTYVGDGADDRNLNIGVDLAGASFVWLMIKSEAAAKPYHRIEYSQGDASMRFDQAVDDPNRIQAFTATGFQLGQGPEVNDNAVTFRYVVLYIP